MTASVRHRGSQLHLWAPIACFPSSLHLKALQSGRVSLITLWPLCRWQDAILCPIAPPLSSWSQDATVVFYYISHDKLRATSSLLSALVPHCSAGPNQKGQRQASPDQRDSASGWCKRSIIRLQSRVLPKGLYSRWTSKASHSLHTYEWET